MEEAEEAENFALRSSSSRMKSGAEGFESLTLLVCPEPKRDELFTDCDEVPKSPPDFGWDFGVVEEADEAAGLVPNEKLEGFLPSFDVRVGAGAFEALPRLLAAGVLKVGEAPADCDVDPKPPPELLEGELKCLNKPCCPPKDDAGWSFRGAGSGGGLREALADDTPNEDPKLLPSALEVDEKLGELVANDPNPECFTFLVSPCVGAGFWEGEVPNPLLCFAGGAFGPCTGCAAAPKRPPETALA